MAIASQPNSWRESDGQWVTSTAIARLGPTPYLHTNAVHVSVGIEGIELDANGNLVVRREYPQGAQIAFCVAEEDESLAKLGVQAGCSGGSAVTTIYLYRGGVRVRADDPMFGPNANLWLMWLSFIPPAAPPVE
ncbi:MAG: hypothetical protein NVV66_18265 [Cellulomonas sp.]|uniref:hypothetical protein n=1 Tax=Cellulomonas sp. TaxID=40001 RepID=UPI00258BEEBA|nr:hypothetical protein [Cellulomonas sp.]MCR6706542.1 hypothetical protein [Cellulomonas sp.]